jgi:uncharacterized protein (DUF849 family)
VSKVIVTCAVTGSIHTPSISEYLPITPDEIAEQAIGAAEAGAAILHLHARDPETGRPSSDPALFEQFVPVIREATDAVINITTGGGAGMSLDERIAAARHLRPEMSSLNLGSMNFGLFPMAQRQIEWKHEWEKPFLEGTRDFVFRNTFEDIEGVVGTLAKDGIRFEFECYDVGHLHNLAYLLEAGVVEPPLFIQTVFGILGGIGPEVENLVHMRRMANKLFGDDYTWSVLAAGRHQLPFVTMGAIMGGNVRVGLEDSLYVGRGRLAKNSAEQVTRIRQILEGLSFELATPDEAREILRLRGRGSATSPEKHPVPEGA